MHELNQPLNRTDLWRPHCSNRETLQVQSRAALLNTNCCPSGTELNIHTASLQGDRTIEQNLSAESASPNYEPMALKMPTVSIIRSFTCYSSWVRTVSSRLILPKLQIPHCCANHSYKSDWQALHTTLGYFTYRHFLSTLYYAAITDCSFNTVNTATLTKSQFIPQGFFFSPLTVSAFQSVERT